MYSRICKYLLNMFEIFPAVLTYFAEFVTYLFDFLLQVIFSPGPVEFFSLSSCLFLSASVRWRSTWPLRTVEGRLTWRRWLRSRGNDGPLWGKDWCLSFLTSRARCGRISYRQRIAQRRISDLICVQMRLSQVLYAIKEYACTAIDVIARRTRLGFLNVQAADEALPRIVHIMGKELDWSQERRTVRCVTRNTVCT